MDVVEIKRWEKLTTLFPTHIRIYYYAPLCFAFSKMSLSYLIRPPKYCKSHLHLMLALGPQSQHFRTIRVVCIVLDQLPGNSHWQLFFGTKHWQLTDIVEGTSTWGSRQLSSPLLLSLHYVHSVRWISHFGITWFCSHLIVKCIDSFSESWLCFVPLPCGSISSVVMILNKFGKDLNL